MRNAVHIADQGAHRLDVGAIATTDAQRAALASEHAPAIVELCAIAAREAAVAYYRAGAEATVEQAAQMARDYILQHGRR